MSATLKTMGSIPVSIFFDFPNVTPLHAHFYGCYNAVKKHREWHNSCQRPWKLLVRYQYRSFLIILILNSFDLQLPREPCWSTRLQQLTGRWQYDRIMWLALRSMKFINVEFLNQFFIDFNKSNYKNVFYTIRTKKWLPRFTMKFLVVAPSPLSILIPLGPKYSL